MTISQAFKEIRSQHPAFQEDLHRSQDIKTILNSFAAILNVLNPLRNLGSVAHPNELLLDKYDAQLVVNASKTIFSYLEARINEWRKRGGAETKNDAEIFF